MQSGNCPNCQLVLDALKDSERQLRELKDINSRVTELDRIQAELVNSGDEMASEFNRLFWAIRNAFEPVIERFNGNHTQMTLEEIAITVVADLKKAEEFQSGQIRKKPK